MSEVLSRDAKTFLSGFSVFCAALRFGRTYEASKLKRAVSRGSIPEPDLNACVVLHACYPSLGFVQHCWAWY